MSNKKEVVFILYIFMLQYSNLSLGEKKNGF